MSKGRAPKSQASTGFRRRRHALKSGRKAADFSKHTRRMPKLHLRKPFEVSGSISMSCKPEQQGSYPCSRSLGKPNHEASECLPEGQVCLDVDPGPGSCQHPELPTSQRQLELLHREGPALRQKATAVPCAGLLGFRLVIKGTSSSRGTEVTTRGFRDAKGLNRQRLCKQTTDGSNSACSVLCCMDRAGALFPPTQTLTFEAPLEVFSIQPIHLADTGSVAVASPGQWQGRHKVASSPLLTPAGPI